MKLPSFLRREPTPAVTPRRLGDRPSLTPEQPGVVRVPAQTVVMQPSGSLRGLPSEERALVAYCCAARATTALELLELVDVTKVGPVLRSAETVVKLERSARIALFSREISGAPSVEARESALRDLRTERSWVKALSCQFMPLELRQQLAGAIPATGVVHPALVSHTRRRIARHLGG